MPGLETLALPPAPVLSRALLPSAEQPGPDLHHLRGRTERVPGERHREPADVYHPHHRGSSGGLPARAPPNLPALLPRAAPAERRHRAGISPLAASWALG